MTGVASALSALLSPDAVLPGTSGAYLADLMPTRVEGRADAIVLPSTAEEVAALVEWCYEHDVPITPRGGGTGLAGGATPLEGGVVLSLERMDKVRSFDPLLWRICVEAGVVTARLQELAREHGLRFAPDTGAAEQSHIGGNIATNAGGPHAFRHGVTGDWVTGLEAVIPPGEIVTVGGPFTKDVASYDLKSLLIGSEGTLGIITAAWLRLMPAPELALPVVAFFRATAAGCDAIESVLGNGIEATAIEYLDGATLEIAGAAFPGGVPDGASFMLIVEVEGSEAEARRLQRELVEAFSDDAIEVRAPEAAAEIAGLWRWRSGVGFAVFASRGGAVAEDIAVPLDRLGEAIEETLQIGTRHDVPALSFGHAGDGNLHSTFLVAVDDDAELARGLAACQDVMELGLRLGGTISGEHGLGWFKRGHLEAQLGPRGYELHRQIKQAFDPKGLLNPGKKD